MTVMALSMAQWGVRWSEDRKLESEARILIEKHGATAVTHPKVAQWEEALRAQPGLEETAKLRSMHENGFWHLVEARAPYIEETHQMAVYSTWFVDAFMLMLLGMQLFRTGVLTGARTRGFYFYGAAYAYAVGLPLNILATYELLHAHGIEWRQPLWAYVSYDACRLILAIGHVF